MKFYLTIVCSKGRFLFNSLLKVLLRRSPGWISHVSDGAIVLKQEIEFQEYTILCFQLVIKKKSIALLELENNQNGLYLQWKSDRSSKKSVSLKKSESIFRWFHFQKELPMLISLAPGEYNLLLLFYPLNWEERLAGVSLEMKALHLNKGTVLLTPLILYHDMRKLAKSIHSYRKDPLPVKEKGLASLSEKELRVLDHERMRRNRGLEEGLHLLLCKCMDATPVHFNCKDALAGNKGKLDELNAFILANLELAMGCKAGGPLEKRNLARHYHLPINAFQEAFAAGFGGRLDQHIKQLRLARVKELMEEGKNSIGQIAMLTGYADVANLSRAVKNKYGHPPGFFMRKAIAGNNSGDNPLDDNEK